MSFRIIGTGMYVPPKAVTNDDLAKIVDTNDEWITKRVGIKERRISETEFTSEMGAKAAKAALDDAGIQASDLDMIAQKRADLFDACFDVSIRSLDHNQLLVRFDV